MASGQRGGEKEKERIPLGRGAGVELRTNELLF